MAQEFPSRINASGFVLGDGSSANERGATTTRQAAGTYDIVLERPLAVGWGLALVTMAGGAPGAAPIVIGNEHTQPDTFQITMAPAGGQGTDQDFYYTIIAIDETQ